MTDGAILEIVNLFPALAITAIFIWYELKRQAQWAAERQEMRAEFMQFLAEQRAATLVTLDVVALRLQQIGDVVMGVADCTHRIENLFDAHDNRAESIAIGVECLRAKMNGKKIVTEEVPQK